MPTVKLSTANRNYQLTIIQARCDVKAVTPPVCPDDILKMAKHDCHLIEQFEDRVVLRSRQCRFAIAGADPESDENEDEWPTCEECAAAQEHIESGAEDEPVEPQVCAPQFSIFSS